MLAAVLALLASVLWGSADFANGLLSRRASFWAVMLVGLGTAALAMLLTVVLFHRPAPSAATLAISPWEACWRLSPLASPTTAA